MSRLAEDSVLGLDSLLPTIPRHSTAARHCSRGRPRTPSLQARSALSCGAGDSAASLPGRCHPSLCEPMGRPERTLEFTPLVSLLADYLIGPVLFSSSSLASRSALTSRPSLLPPRQRLLPLTPLLRPIHSKLRLGSELLRNSAGFKDTIPLRGTEMLRNCRVLWLPTLAEVTMSLLLSAAL